MFRVVLRRIISVSAATSIGVVGVVVTGSLVSVSAAGNADLSVGVSGPSTATTGQQIIFNLSLFNNGPDPSTGVMLTNTFSNPVTFYPSSSSGPCTETSSTVIACGPATIYPGQAPDWSIAVSTGTAGTLTDNVTGTENETDPNPANNTAQWSTSVSQAVTADLSVSKSASPGPYFVGNTFDYFLFFGNNGPADATNVTMTDQLPPQVQFVSAEAPCTANGNLVTCNVGTVRARALGDGIRVTVAAISSGTAVNTVNITGDQQDPNPANNSYSLTLQIQPPTADLAVTKTGSPDPVVAGQKETYTITVTNNGPLSATGVVAQDAWSAASGIKGGIAFKSVSTTQGACAQSVAGISCDLGSLASGATATITLVLQPRSKGTLSDTATVSGNEVDPNSSNNSATLLTTVG